MLEEDGFLATGRFTGSSWNSEKLQNVSIACSHAVLFKLEAVLLNDLLESLVEIWVCPIDVRLYDFTVLLEFLIEDGAVPRFSHCS